MSTIHEYYRDRYAEQTPGAPTLADEGTFELRVRTALAAIGTRPCRVLDFGCNVGAAAQRFLDAGHDVAGADISESAVRLAHVRLPRARFAVIESEARLPFGDAAFDACFCSEVIEHLFDVRGFLREVHRVVRPGGLLLVTTPYHGWFKNLLIITVNFDRHFAPTGGHIRFFSLPSLTHLLQVNGFRVERVRGIGRRWPVWKSMFVSARRQP
jgi:SAM-dependent methyltransferase